MLPYKIWMDSNGEWFFEVYDTVHQLWVSHGSFEDEEQAEYAALRFLQHE